MTYPLYEHEKDNLKAPSGRRVGDFTVERLASGELTPDDLGITEEALEAQARIAERSGFPQVATNLRRAAEMTRIPDAEILQIYEALRPGRSQPEDLEALARRVEVLYNARLTTAFLREAATVLRSMHGGHP